MRAGPGRPSPDESDDESRDREKRNELFELLYTDLRRQAGAYMRRQASSHTLQPTALVHEAFMRLASQCPELWDSPQQFKAVAARAMISVLVDHARARGRKKRKAPGARVPLDTLLVHFEDQSVDVIDLQEKLEVLSSLGPEQYRARSVVELRAFGGLTMSEVAHYLDTPKRTIERDFRFARAWLHCELGLGSEPQGTQRA